MQTKDILQADVLDILFEGRNKAYGAYQLRKNYSKRITYALIGTFAICALLIASSILANAMNKKKVIAIVGPEISLKKYFQEEKKPEPPKVEPPKVEPPRIETVKFTAPKIVENDAVTDDDIVKDILALNDVKIGNANIDGDKYDGTIAPPIEVKGTGTNPALKVEEDYDTEFKVVQIPAEFPGGTEAWRKFLERNLNRETPMENGAPEGKYTVQVSFIVAKDGSISDVRAENNPGYGTAEEAVKVIKRGPDWKPAIQNGRNVIYRHKQSITFLVANE